MWTNYKKKKVLDDLHSPLQRRLLFSKPAFEIVSDYKYIETLGKEILQENMKYCRDVLKFPPFDPDNPYEDYDSKNLYFSAANQLCQFSLWRHRLHALSEMYYSTMLETIKQFESNSYNHNKGMVYANLGIAQAIQGKIDKGFSNILKAIDEDRGYFKKERNPAQEIFNSILFKQLEKGIILEPLERQLKSLKDEGESCPNAEDYLKSMVDPDQRIFFEYTYARVLENYEVWKEKANRFSANRMLAYLQDMCLFAEDFLKRKGYPGMLNSLISHAFSGIDLSDCAANSYEELNEKLEAMYAETNKRDRALRMLLTLRNFSSHNVCAGEKEDFVFRCFGEVLHEILRAIVQIYNVPGFS